MSTVFVTSVVSMGNRDGDVLNVVITFVGGIVCRLTTSAASVITGMISNSETAFC